MRVLFNLFFLGYFIIVVVGGFLQSAGGGSCVGCCCWLVGCWASSLHKCPVRKNDSCVCSMNINTHASHVNEREVVGGVFRGAQCVLVISAKNKIGLCDVAQIGCKKYIDIICSFGFISKEKYMLMRF